MEQQDEDNRAERLLKAGWKQVPYFGLPACWRTPDGKMLVQNIQDAICNLNEEERRRVESGG